jgi:hypothetical protein
MCVFHYFILLRKNLYDAKGVAHKVKFLLCIWATE